MDPTPTAEERARQAASEAAAPEQAAAPVYIPYPAATEYPQRPVAEPRPREKRSGCAWYVWLIGGCLGVVVIVALLCALVFGAMFGAFLHFAHQQTASSTTTQSFTVGGSPTIVVNGDTVQLTIASGAEGQVGVQITKSARDDSSERAHRDLDAIGVKATQTGDTITITTQGETRDGGFFQSRSVELTITTPPATNVQTDLHTGSVTLSGLTGAMRLLTQTGEVSATDVTFTNASSIHTETGSTHLDAALADGATLDVSSETGDVDITLPANATTHLVATATTGDVNVSGWSFASSSGAHSFTGDTAPHPTSALTAHVTTGSVEIHSR